MDRALVRREPKRRIAASHGLTETALGRHERAHLPRALVAAHAAREAASADALLAETMAMQGKALDLMARAEAEGDIRGAIVALREARECVALRGKLATELRAAEPSAPGVEPLRTIVVEFVRPSDLAEPSQPVPFQA